MSAFNPIYSETRHIPTHELLTTKRETVFFFWHYMCVSLSFKNSLRRRHRHPHSRHHSGCYLLTIVFQELQRLLLVCL